MAAANGKKAETIEIRPINIRSAAIRIEGDTPLIVHAWSDKAKLMMLEAQTGKADGKKKPKRRPAEDFVESLYWMTPKISYSDDATDDEIMTLFEEAVANGARFGFPATAIKQAATAAAYRLDAIKNQTGMRGAFFIGSDERGLVEIHGDKPTIREDMVKIGMGTADLRYRPQFSVWYIDLVIQYNAESSFSLENIVNALNAGGFVCGIGEWRPEKKGGGLYGRFHVSRG